MGTQKGLALSGSFWAPLGPYLCCPEPGFKGMDPLRAHALLFRHPENLQTIQPLT